jgi:uncharacterized protein YndB with AHSA1/START domain
VTDEPEPEGAIRRERLASRVFDAPRELLWRAWTDPQQLAEWWGPQGYTTPVESIQLDLRPGGAFRFTMVAEDTGVELLTDMHFVEVVEPERIVFAWNAHRGLGSGQVAVTFTDLGEKTEVTTDYTGYATDQVAEQSAAGWDSQFDRLDALLAGA